MTSNPRRRRARPRKRLIIRPPNYAPNRRARRNPMPVGTAWTGHKANFISPKGNYGIVPSSELAMSTGIADKPVVQFALFSDKGRWPHVTWAHVQTADGRVTDGLPSEVLPAEVRRKLGGFGNEKMPKGASQKHEYALNGGARANQLKQYAVFRYQYREMPAPKWGAVDATGPFPRGTNWRDLLPPGVLSKPGILGICAKTKSDAIRRGMNEFALHGGKQVEENPRKVHQMIVRAFLDGRKAHAGRRYWTDGKNLRVWNNLVAEKQQQGILLRDCGWRTLLTRNVLNELLSQMGIPGSIRQVKHVWVLGGKPWPGQVLAPYKTLPKPMNGTAGNPAGRLFTREHAAHKRRVLAQIAAHKKSLKKHPMVTVGRFRNWKSLRKGMRSLQDDAGIWTAQAWRKKGQSWKVDVRSYHKTAARRALRGLARGNPVVDLTIRKTFQGALSISAIVGGYRVERQYMGYTKREAIAMFRSYIKTMKRNPLTRKESARVLREARHHERLSGFYSKGIAKGLTRAVEIAGPKKASRAAGILGMRAAGFRPEEYRKYYPNPRSCKLCGGPLMKMGGLGNLMWYRCRNCGMETSVKK